MLFAFEGLKSPPRTPRAPRSPSAVRRFALLVKESAL